MKPELHDFVLSLLTACFGLERSLSEIYGGHKNRKYGHRDDRISLEDQLTFVRSCVLPLMRRCHSFDTQSITGICGWIIETIASIVYNNSLGAQDTCARCIVNSQIDK